MRTYPESILVGAMVGLPQAIATGPIGFVATATGLGLGVLLLEARLDVKIPQAIDDARRFCEGREAKPDELALVRYYPDERPAC